MTTNNNDGTGNGKGRGAGWSRIVGFVRHASPAAVGGALVGLTWMKRSSLEDYIASKFPNIGQDVKDGVNNVKTTVGMLPANKLGTDAKTIEARMKNLGTEFCLRPEFREHMEKTVRTLKEIDVHYNSLGMRVREWGTYATDVATRTSVTIRDSVDNLLGKTAEVVGLQNEYTMFRSFAKEIPDRAALSAAKPYIQKKFGMGTYQKLETALEDGKTLDEAVISLERQVGTQKRELEEMSRVVRKRLVDEFVEYMAGIRKICRTQLDTANLADVYAKVIDDALERYQWARDEKTLRDVEQYIQKQSQKEVGEIAQQLGKEQDALKSFFGRFQELQTKVGEKSLSIKELHEMYFDLERVYKDYTSIANQFPDDYKSKFEELSTQIDKQRRAIGEKYEIAKKDPDVIQVVGSTEQPSKPYNTPAVIADLISVGLSAAIGLGVVGIYAHRAKEGIKDYFCKKVGLR